MVWELVARPSMEPKCGGQEHIMHAGSWSRPR